MKKTILLSLFILLNKISSSREFLPFQKVTFLERIGYKLYDHNIFYLLIILGIFAIFFSIYYTGKKINKCSTVSFIIVAFSIYMTFNIYIKDTFY